MQKKTTIVTIDGPAGVGKTTIARRLADTLGISYLDTGAMFRTLALKIGEAGALDFDDQSIMKFCDGLHFSLEGRGLTTQLFVNGIRIGKEIRSEKVAMLASTIASRPIIRDCLAAAQRSIGTERHLVAEGRDMGTVIFPLARFKFFLDATAEIRALRRMRDAENQEKHIDLASLTAQIRARDEQDRNRSVAPLRPASDAMSIDTSSRDISEVLGIMLRHIDASGGKALFGC
ncbi:MAG: (d)CMP kinase [Desulfovibrio sp.]|nr:(d)CMP kinase [Desulfovibrio sp.]